ncbi:MULTISPECIES: hypothetical protein [Endozoicomonas]|uniref:hypothetical protein n=1 Tax=Endozoicomonas TaxID=305899 RepID=UPI000824820A|nr:hypothetical protein [Endozoicomonas atrinae]
MTEPWFYQKLALQRQFHNLCERWFADEERLFAICLDRHSEQAEMEEYPDFEEEFEKAARAKKRYRTRQADYEKKRSKAELHLERKRLRELLGDEHLVFDHW